MILHNHFFFWKSYNDVKFFFFQLIWCNSEKVLSKTFLIYTRTQIYTLDDKQFLPYMNCPFQKFMHTTSWICNHDTLICKSAGPFVTRTETLPCYLSDVTISIVHSLARVEHCTFGNIWMWACFCLFLKTTCYLHLPDNIYESN